MHDTCASRGASRHELAGFEILCLLGAIQTGHGHSHFSHLKSGKEIMKTEYGEMARW